MHTKMRCACAYKTRCARAELMAMYMRISSVCSAQAHHFWLSARMRFFSRDFFNSQDLRNKMAANNVLVESRNGTMNSNKSKLGMGDQTSSKAFQMCCLKSL